MKKKILPLLAMAIVSFWSVTAFGQQDSRVPAWLSDKGYWVAETHLKEPKQAIIRFYNNDHVLVGVYNLSGSRLKLAKTKVKMQLKTMLETSLLQWANRQKENQSDSGFAAKP